MTSLRAIAESFSPDAIVSHAYEGGHIDHDACSFLALHVAEVLSLKRYEFPMYWLDASGQAVLQQFRDVLPEPASALLSHAAASALGKGAAEEVCGV